MVAEYGGFALWLIAITPPAVIAPGHHARSSRPVIAPDQYTLIPFLFNDQVAAISHTNVATRPRFFTKRNDSSRSLLACTKGVIQNAATSE